MRVGGPAVGCRRAGVELPARLLPETKCLFESFPKIPANSTDKLCIKQITGCGECCLSILCVSRWPTFKRRSTAYNCPADIPQRRYARRYCRPQRLVSGHGRPLVLAVDTNVLVYAADADSQFHAPCRDWLERRRRYNAQSGLQCIIGSGCLRASRSPTG